MPASEESFREVIRTMAQGLVLGGDDSLVQVILCTISAVVQQSTEVGHFDPVKFANLLMEVSRELETARGGKGLDVRS